MLLINFSKKASVVFSRIKPRTYLMLFILGNFRLINAAKSSENRFPSSDIKAETYEVLFSIGLWIIVVIVSFISYKILKEVGNKTLSKTTKVLIANLYSARENATYIKERQKLLMYTNTNLGRSGISISSKLSDISNSLDTEDILLKDRLSPLINCANEIAQVTKILNKYLT